jgi:hypothetical protein
MNNINVETLYDNMQDKIVQDICKDDKLNCLWNEINELDELLRNTLSKEDYNIFDDYLSKKAELIDLERKKAFSYGYKLSNKLMIDSLRE